jgi:hypothetical protein
MATMTRWLDGIRAFLESKADVFELPEEPEHLGVSILSAGFLQLGVYVPLTSREEDKSEVDQIPWRSR